MGVGAGFCVYDVVVKSSRSLSHLVMSSCFDFPFTPYDLEQKQELKVLDMTSTAALTNS